MNQVANTSTGGPLNRGASPLASKRRRRTPGELLAAYGAVGVLLIVIIVFSIWLPSTYPTGNNVHAIFIAESPVLMLSLALLVPAVVGQFDLSVGSMLAFASVTVAKLLSGGMPLGLAIVLTLLCGAAIGLAAGLLVVRIGVSSFIATLGISTILTGLAAWISGGLPVVQGIPASVSEFGQKSFGDIPISAAEGIVVAAIMWYVFTHTRLGRNLYATGGNPVAARLSGVRTKLITAGAFVASGTIAALAGVVSMMSSGTGDPSVGPDLLLPAFAAVFLGATTIRPGHFNVVGTVVGILLVAAGVSGLQQLGAQSYVVPLFNGFVLVLAVSVSRALSRTSSSTL